MQTVEIPLGQRSYRVDIGAKLLESPEHWLDCVGGGLILVVSNERVAPLYLHRVLDCLPKDRAHSLILPDGEQHKTVSSWRRIVNELVSMKANRDACLIALGGGVIGDLGGFAAATYMRGIRFVQAPTTLLAQVDASVGGKTGVNHAHGKNLIGAFHQPTRVLADTATLDTLEDREYRAGIAEVIKYGMIRDADFFGWIENQAGAVSQRDPQTLLSMVRRSVENKAAVVAEDELETHTRALLNYGHSFGHALETLTRYEHYLHGEAVAIGMVIAARLSEQRGRLAPGVADRLQSVLNRFGLPTRFHEAIKPNAILDAMTLDKKNVSGKLRLVLLRGLGEAYIDQDCSREQVLEAVRSCREA